MSNFLLDFENVVRQGIGMQEESPSIPISIIFQYREIIRDHMLEIRHEAVSEFFTQIQELLVCYEKELSAQHEYIEGIDRLTNIRKLLIFFTVTDPGILEQLPEGQRDFIDDRAQELMNSPMTQTRRRLIKACGNDGMDKIDIPGIMTLDLTSCTTLEDMVVAFRNGLIKEFQ